MNGQNCYQPHRSAYFSPDSRELCMGCAITVIKTHIRYALGGWDEGLFTSTGTRWSGQPSGGDLVYALTSFWPWQIFILIDEYQERGETQDLYLPIRVIFFSVQHMADPWFPHVALSLSLISFFHMPDRTGRRKRRNHTLPPASWVAVQAENHTAFFCRCSQSPVHFSQPILGRMLWREKESPERASN